jgi:O-antigen ligase
VKALAIPKRPLALLVGFCIAGVIFFHSFSIAGFGATFAIFLLIFLLAVLAIIGADFKIPYNKTLNRLFIAHLFFSLALFYSFYMNGSMTGEDSRYLLANAANIFWWHMLFVIAIHQRNLFCYSFKLGYVILAYLAIFCWLIFVFKSGDVFFLRNKIIDANILNFTMMKNPNRFARILIIPTVILYFFYCLDRPSYERRSYHLLGLIIAMSCIIITTLSRANLLSLLIFGFMAVAISRSARIRFAKILAKGPIIVVFAIVILVFIPEIPKLFSLLKYKMAFFYSNLSAEDARTVRGGGPRVRTWLASLNIIRDNMLYGVGFSGVNQVLEEYGSVRLADVSRGMVITVHGGFLKNAVYGGLIGLGAFLLFYILMLWYSVKKFLTARVRWNKMAAYSALILLIMMIPVNIAGDCFGLSLTWMSISFLFVNSQIDADPQAEYPRICYSIDVG